MNITSDNVETCHPNIFGRFISPATLQASVAWPTASSTFCLRQLENEKLPHDYIFVSHAWLSREHPDPLGAKHAGLLHCYQKVEKLRAHLSVIDPIEIDRDWQQALLSELIELPMLADVAEESKSQRFGIPWREDGADAGVKFHRWITSSLDRFLAAPVWIDSYALPAQAHRDSCDYCKAVFMNLLFRIPELIARGTCLALPTSKPSDLGRGWVMLEQTVALVAKRLAVGKPPEGASDWGQLVENQRNRFLGGGYQCGTHYDGVRLPILMANERVRWVACQMLDSNSDFMIHDAPLEPMLVSWARVALSKGPEDCALSDRICHALKCATNSEFLRVCQSIGALSYRAGQVALLSQTYLTVGCLVSHLWHRGRKIEHDAVETLLQACIYKFLYLDQLSVELAVNKLLAALQQITNLQLDENVSLCSINGAEVEQVIEIFRHWDGGGTVGVDLNLLQQNNDREFESVYDNLTTVEFTDPSDPKIYEPDEVSSPQ